MLQVGLPISRKENEKRRALIPEDLRKLRHPDCIWIEKSYGDVLGYTDKDYIECGANVVPFEEVLKKDIICDPKIGDEQYLNKLRPGQCIFGWVHAVQNRDITDTIVNNGLSAYAWEDMFDEGRHCFWHNNVMAGEAAILHAFQIHGIMPEGKKVALIGRGNVASGALRILTGLGANVTVYNRATEKLFQREMDQYEVVVNGLLWDTSRKDHIIYRSDLSRLPKDALIIDISCDHCGAIETSHATTIEDPIYTVDGVTHYAVDHTPALVYKTVSTGLSEQVALYIDELIEEKPGKILRDALIIDKGEIIDDRIKVYQNR